MRRTLSILLLIAAPRLAAAQVVDSARLIAAPRLTASQVVDSAQLNVALPTSPLAALAGKIAGARVVTLSGSPGTPAALILRASASHAIPDPLIVIDGTVSRASLADVNVADIEQIEVLKGSAAGALYGIGAANGVVRITTKRGRDVASNETRVSLRSEMGQTSLPRVLPVSLHHRFQLNAAGDDFLRDANGNRLLETDRINDNAYPILRDPARTLLTGHSQVANHLAAAHRTQGTAVFASLDHTRDPGVLQLLNGYGRRAARLNIDQSVGGRFNLDGGLYVAASANDQTPSHGNDIGMLRLIEPHARLDSTSTACGVGTCYAQFVPIGNPSANGTNPLFDLQQATSDLDAQRFNGGINASYRILDWLSAKAGYASEKADHKARLLGYYSPATLTRAGQRLADASRVNTTSIQVTGDRSFFGVRTSTRLGWIDERQRTRAEMRTFTEPDVPNTPFAASSILLSGKLQSFLFGTAVSPTERLTFDVGVRRDEETLFGARGDKPIYHRFAASYLGKWDVRLRAAQGTSTYPLDVEEVFLPPTAPAGPKLNRPYVRETEIGFEAPLRRRVTVSYIYARERVAGYPALVPLPSSTGFTEVMANVGSVLGRTHEATLAATVLDRANSSLRLNLVAHRTRSKVEKLYYPEFLYGASFQYRLQEGAEFGDLWGTRWIRTAAQLQETIDVGQLTGTAADYVVNEEGYFVRASQHRTVDEVPLQHFTCVRIAGACAGPGSALQKLGNVVPDLELGFTTEARWKALSAQATFTGALGGDVLNAARRFGFFAERDPVFDQSSKPVAERKPGTYYRAFSTVGATDYFVESRTHVKLRELAVDWVLPSAWTSRLRSFSPETRLGLVGRNLWSSGTYTGYDPDVAAGSAAQFGFGVDGGGYPAYRTVGAVLKVGF